MPTIQTDTSGDRYIVHTPAQQGVFTPLPRLWLKQTEHKGWHLGPSPNLLGAAAFRSLTNLPIPSAAQQQGDALSPAIPWKRTGVCRAKN